MEVKGSAKKHGMNAFKLRTQPRLQSLPYQKERERGKGRKEGTNKSVSEMNRIN